MHPTAPSRINAGVPSVGRAAITEAAQSFMTAFPDMQVLMDDVRPGENGIEYHWTLVGTNTGPGGTGNSVRVSGIVLAEDAGGLVCCEYISKST
jgi:hypothetical protein